MDNNKNEVRTQPTSDGFNRTGISVHAKVKTATMIGIDKARASLDHFEIRLYKHVPYEISQALFTNNHYASQRVNETRCCTYTRWLVFKVIFDLIDSSTPQERYEWMNDSERHLTV